MPLNHVCLANSEFQVAETSSQFAVEIFTIVSIKERKMNMDTYEVRNKFEESCLWSFTRFIAPLHPFLWIEEEKSNEIQQGTAQNLSYDMAGAKGKFCNEICSPCIKLLQKQPIALSRFPYKMFLPGVGQYHQWSHNKIILVLTSLCQRQTYLWRWWDMIDESFFQTTGKETYIT